MDRAAAVKLLNATLKLRFDHSRFAQLASNMLQRYETEPYTPPAQNIREMFRRSVRRFERLGWYSVPDGKNLNILIVELGKWWRIA